MDWWGIVARKEPRRLRLMETFPTTTRLVARSEWPVAFTTFAKYAEVDFLTWMILHRQCMPSAVRAVADAGAQITPLALKVAVAMKDVDSLLAIQQLADIRHKRVVATSPAPLPTLIVHYLYIVQLPDGTQWAPDIVAFAINIHAPWQIITLLLRMGCKFSREALAVAIREHTYSRDMTDFMVMGAMWGHANPTTGELDFIVQPLARQRTRRVWSNPETFASSAVTTILTQLNYSFNTAYNRYIVDGEGWFRWVSAPNCRRLDTIISPHFALRHSGWREALTLLCIAARRVKHLPHVPPELWIEILGFYAYSRFAVWMPGPT